MKFVKLSENEPKAAKTIGAKCEVFSASVPELKKPKRVPITMGPKSIIIQRRLQYTNIKMQPPCSRDELLRYNRHVILPEVGVEGQQKLKAAKVLLIGAGGLGSPTALYLAAAGVGTLGIVDFDEVDLSNLHRQIIHGTPDVGRSKIDSAEESIQAVNPNVRVIKHQTMLTRDNALQIINGYDLVVDGTDNFQTRYLVNDSCVLLGKMNMYGSIYGFEGQATVFCAPGGPCYRCLYPEPPPPGLVPSCAENGVFGVLPGIIGLIQATEVVKAILEIGETLTGRLILYDALGMRFMEVKIQRDPACPVCGDSPTIKELIDYNQFCGIKPKSKVEQEIDCRELLAMIDRKEPYQLVDVREQDEYDLCRIPGSIHIPLAFVLSRINELDRSKKTVVQCHSGVRSAKASSTLRQNGFETVFNLKGGIADWMKVGGPVEP